MKKEIRTEEHERSYCSNFVLAGRDFRMKYLLLFCIVLFSGCKDEYDSIQDVKRKIEECKIVEEQINTIFKLNWEMRRELKINTQLIKDPSGVYFKESPSAKYFELIAFPYVEGLRKQFKEKDCDTYL